LDFDVLGIINLAERDDRIKALAERSTYIENVLRHAFGADLSSLVWRRDPFAALQAEAQIL
jgi:hypothetical protein